MTLIGLAERFLLRQGDGAQGSYGGRLGEATLLWELSSELSSLFHSSFRLEGSMVHFGAFPLQG
ncbi:MAG: hypothetical protein ABSF38_10235, partial [Verrucomicrobiota bacterium]